MRVPACAYPLKQAGRRHMYIWHDILSMFYHFPYFLMSRVHVCLPLSILCRLRGRKYSVSYTRIYVSHIWKKSLKVFCGPRLLGLFTVTWHLQKFFFRRAQPFLLSRTRCVYFAVILWLYLSCLCMCMCMYVRKLVLSQPYAN